MLKIVNLTPHEVHLYNREGTEVQVVFPAYPQKVRCKLNTHVIATKKYKSPYDGKEIEIDITHSRFDEVINMPAPRKDTIFIVSKLVAEQLKPVRNDLYITNGIIRDKNIKTIIGCRSLGVI